MPHGSCVAGYRINALNATYEVSERSRPVSSPHAKPRFNTTAISGAKASVTVSPAHASRPSRIRPRPAPVDIHHPPTEIDDPHLADPGTGIQQGGGARLRQPPVRRNTQHAVRSGSLPVASKTARYFGRRCTQIHADAVCWLKDHGRPAGPRRETYRN
jgi:hypothetical protein